MRNCFMAICVAILGTLVLINPAVAQDEGAAVVTVQDAHSDLESILARQRGEDVGRTPRDFNSALGHAAGLTNQLGPLGGPSDAMVWEALRFGTADVTVSAGGAPARVLMQDGGMWWYETRAGTLRPYGGVLMLGVLLLLLSFFLVRGRIAISSGRSGETITRFKGIERFAHWLLAGSFILLGITGLISLFGRVALIPLFGKDGFASLALASKWVHNNVSWAFMLALVLVFVFWVSHNLPSRQDLVWFAKGGGMFGSEHPPARKFNAGQKIIFWSVIILGASISLSGLSLLFPFELPMFAKTFALLNELSIPKMFLMDPLPEKLAPHEEMQYAQLWHAVVSFVLMAIVFAHIYIGSVGMEGAYEAMGSGEVDLNWAKEHHSLWVEEVQAKGGAVKGTTSPAE